MVMTACVVCTSLGRTAEAPDKKAKRRVITLATCYLIDTLEGAHRILLEADMHAFKGTLTLDPNVCGLNNFGDPTICTEIAPRKIKVELAPTDTADPSGQNRNLYGVIGKGLRNPLFLVELTQPGSSFRFVSRAGDDVARVVTLEVLKGLDASDQACAAAKKPGPAPGSLVQVVTGTSKKLSYDEALADAVGKLKIPFPDALLYFTVIKESGQVGEFAGVRELSVTIRASMKPPADGKRRYILVKTCYLHKQLERSHQLTLWAEMHELSGKLTLDGNTCELNYFGDPTKCTKMLPPTIDVTLSQLRLADPSGQNRKIYRVEGKGLANELFFVVPTKPNSAYRFVSRGRSNVRRVVTLETPRGRAATCCGKCDKKKDKPKAEKE
jgi:hypothetical protein